MPKNLLRLSALGLVATLSICWAAVGCGRKPVTSANRTYPYKIVTTVGMVSDIVRQVAGDKAVVEGLMGEAVDPHTYRPTQADLARLMSADVIVYNGLLLEGRMTDSLVRVGRSKPVFAVSERIDPSYLLEKDGHPDPHVWMDPSAWKRCVEAVASALGEFDPPHRDSYAANARSLNEQIDRLDEYARAAIATIPPRQRVLITSHDAFRYFGRAYGLEVMGIQGLSTESEAGLDDINRLVRLIVDRDIRAVFVESSVGPKNIQALVEGVKSRGRDLAVGGTLFSDAMGPPGTYEGTYIGMIDHNVTTIVRALGGQAPPRGMQGKLAQ